MESIKTQHELRAAIIRLEYQQSDEGRALKEQFHLAYNSVKPANIILNTLKDLGDSNFVKDGFLNTSVGFGTGYLSKMIFQGVVNSPVKKLLGSVLMYGITNFVSRNPDGIKLMGKKLFKMFGSKSTAEEKEPENY
ncbi:MAG: hypothetical protein A3F91_00175 [Flavobacteria bacterium RIFCSPLOWO2_12_FULL_35_11]|nr:MAG: hypothetical protein A3F91_00175 [Flavobacteria bacterium RIFCSPLOWO2_12_FULL_35_11]